MKINQNSLRKSCVEISRVSKNHQIDYLNWSPQCLEVHAGDDSTSNSEMEKGWKAAHLIERNNLFQKKTPNLSS